MGVVFPRYLHVGEGAGQGAGTRPPLLLQSSAQHLKLPLLLPHRGQQGGRTRTLLHSHAESRAQDRTGQGRVNTRQKERFNQHRDLIKGETHSKAESPKYTDIKTEGPSHTEVLMKLIFRGYKAAGADAGKQSEGEKENCADET